MFFSYKSLFYHFASYLIITSSLVCSDNVPTILWNIKGDALHIKPVSALGPNDNILTESLKDIHDKKSNILVFALNRLSLEDFSASDKPRTANISTLHNIESFLDTHPYMLLSSVKDPLNYIHKAHCGVQEIVVDNKIDESILSSVSSAMERSCVVILHISDDGIVSREDEVETVFLPSLGSTNNNIVGVFTAPKSSWGAPNTDRHLFRNLLEVDASENNFVNYTGCLIMYVENATALLNNNSVSLPFPPKLDGSSCGNTSSLLQLSFETSGSISSVVIKLNFTLERGAWKTGGTISMTGKGAYDDEVDLNTESIEAPSGFSYSCGDIDIRAKNKTFDVAVKFDGFQIQPFQVKDVFSESFDCVPFFTVPIWMGVFASLTCIIITSIGVYALFSVHTMDRFDDPKGKTITVGSTGD